MSLRRLKLMRECILELPQLKDYGGQSLIFRPDWKVRVVTEDVFNNPTLVAYREQLLLAEVDEEGNLAAPTAAPAAPAVIENTPEVKTDPETPPAENSSSEPAVTENSESTPEQSSDSTDSTGSAESSGGIRVRRRR